MLKLTQILSMLSQQPDTVLMQKKGMDILAKAFLSDIAGLTKQLKQNPKKRYALCYQDSYLFCIGLFAILSIGAEPILLPNNQAGTQERLASEFDALLTDDTVFEPADMPFDNTRLKPTQTIRIFTSGSTGEPQKVSRQLQHLDAEIAALESCFSSYMTGKTVYSSVSHQHIYGLLFFILWPLCSGRTIQLQPLRYPESFNEKLLQPRSFIFISSPAFLSRLSLTQQSKTNTTLFSSGSLLKQATANQLKAHLGEAPFEILGSTETSGVAYRQQGETDEETAWENLPGVQVDIDANTQQLRVCSPFFDAPQAGFLMNDRATAKANHQFILHERTDRIAKIEGKRVSLSDIENHLIQSPYVEEAYALALEEKRQFTAAIIVPSSKAWGILEQQGKQHLNQLITQSIAPYFDAILLPKKFRYRENIPTNAQGKHVLNELKALFESKPTQLPEVIQVENTDQGCLLHLNMSENLACFKGHFEKTPILPGVAQLQWVLIFAKKYANIDYQKAKVVDALKFTHIIQPNQLVKLLITPCCGKLVFRYFDDNTTFSQGRIRITAGDT